MVVRVTVTTAGAGAGAEHQGGAVTQCVGEQLRTEGLFSLMYSLCLSQVHFLFFWFILTSDHCLFIFSFRPSSLFSSPPLLISFSLTKPINYVLSTPQ